MNLFELNCLLVWLNEVGVENFGELKHLKDLYGIANNKKMLNFANGCFVYDLKLKDLM